MERRVLANAIRALSMDAVQKANSGHPGAPMGMADIAEVLWRDFMNHNPSNPQWSNRDRFILSNGHGSMLLYSLLHLTGYDLSIEDLKQFRQLHSKTPGHPEYGYAPGVETTTGPLGQGIANGVGMALAEKVLGAHFNRPGLDVVDHFTYVFMGDGCMMEGISHEVCSLAGTLKLGKLVAFWDDNGISIDGHVEGWFTDNTPARFEAYGWHVIRQVDGHNAAAIKAAIEEAQSVTDKPTLICCKTIIGFGSPNKSGSHDCHGSPLGAAEVQAAREALGWSYEPFVIPTEIAAMWDAKEIGQVKESAWDKQFAEYSKQFPELAQEFTRRVNGELPETWAAKSVSFVEKLQAEPATLASRKASQNAIEAYAAFLPELLGGSADLAPSNLTMWSGSESITPENAAGNYIHYGVREFGMSALMNGVALHGGFIPYGATFLMFMEYARNAVRMAALMKQRSIFVYTHDSIGLGEDGPTHQPVEQLTSLRSTPNLSTWRPCDQVETAVSWKFAIENKNGPTALIFSRQNLAQHIRTTEQLNNVKKGGYVLKEPEGEVQAIIIATGSEVSLAIQASDELATQGINVRVVSMPSTDVFDAQSKEYKDSVLPTNIRNRVAIEAASKDLWFKYVGLDGSVIGMETFGESAPAELLYEHFGITKENLIKAIKEHK
ncbi:transketolase [Tolumonas osonensis]|uniref:Transketolase n=1 Tax=Tolumonas osonensis TaxID=675874 RepID=A0A841GLS2_9GAMM|nr:transketolase [Tolumonas osonensis]MBB6054443.1 transketolase [Tolumonas osonensis]